MPHGQTYIFQDFILDTGNVRLFHGSQQLRLRPKAFAMLCYFVQRSGHLVTKDELFHALWPNVVVESVTLTGCVRELRALLKDNTKRPRFIETVPTKGYRFIAKVGSRQSSEKESQKAKRKNIRDPVFSTQPSVLVFPSPCSCWTRRRTHTTSPLVSSSPQGEPSGRVRHWRTGDWQNFTH
jgi:DNA-binding winged helix-turn-helix (wHTH) protein